MSSRKGTPYAAGELELLLSLAPTHANIQYLSQVLQRSEPAIAIAFKKAYERGAFGKSAVSQGRKIAAAKRRVGIAI